MITRSHHESPSKADGILMALIIAFSSISSSQFGWERKNRIMMEHKSLIYDERMMSIDWIISTGLLPSLIATRDWRARKTFGIFRAVSPLTIQSKVHHQKS